MLSLGIFILASILASGIVFKHTRLTTFIATAGTLFEAHWLLAVLLSRTLLQRYPADYLILFFSVLALLIWGSKYRQWSWPGVSPQQARNDLPVLLIIAITLASAALILSANGFFDHAWKTHGFFNGDTLTFAALVQKSLSTEVLVDQNPFAANGPLEYPTLVHAGFAQLLHTFHSDLDWFRFIPLTTYLQIILTIPLFFLLWDTVYPEPAAAARRWFGVSTRIIIIWLQAAVVLYVMSLSWDNYVYLQSHFLLTALFLLLLSLCTRYYPSRGREQFVLLLPGAMVIILLFSNALTGTTATALGALFATLRAFDKSRSIRERGAWLLVPIVAVLLFLVFTPGQGSFNWPHFPYEATISFSHLAVPALLLIIGSWLGVSRHLFLNVSLITATLLALVTFFFSNREIVVDNASRFVYHALLIGYVTAAVPLIRSWHWWRREFIYSTRTVPELFIGWGGLLIIGFLIILNPLTSIAGTHDKLLYKDQQIITLGTQHALWWIRENTAADAVFAASPAPPWAIPLFTGRALLRAQYWLSPQDQELSQLEAAFAGDRGAQAQVLADVDYLFLTQAQRPQWEPVPYAKVLDNTEVVIYQIK